MTSIICAADHHLRDRQYNRSDRGQDFVNAIYRLIDIAVARKSEAIISGGDLLDGTRPSPWLIGQLLQIHMKLIEAGLPFFVVSGNHDRTDPHWASILGDAALSDCCGLKLIDNKSVTTASGIRIHGIPFLPLDQLRQALADAPACDILVSHFTYDKFAAFPGAELITENDFKSRFRVAIIGDIHVQQNHMLADGRIICSPGSTELCSSAEAVEKTVVELEFDKGEFKGGDFAIPLPTRKVLTYHIENEADLKDVVEKLVLEKDKNPIVFVRFNPAVADVSKRLKTVLDTDRCILRMGYTERFAAPFLNQEAGVVDLKPVDFLKEFAVAGTPIFACAESLLRPELALDFKAATEMVDTYFDTRLAALAV